LARDPQGADQLLPRHTYDDNGERLTGAYGLGLKPASGLQQATLAIRARAPLRVLEDTIQPFPSFSEIYAAALKALHRQVIAVRQPVARRA
jgi:pyruvate/2-oxoglutarate dehydrogenase complex dihydrolipoamide dehydrogenase (E3) component